MCYLCNYHSPMHEHLDYLQYFAIMNNDTINTLVDMCFCFFVVVVVVEEDLQVVF